MSSGKNNWYVITGAPSSGKSTTLDALARQGYKTVPEMARVFIEDELRKGRTLTDIQPDSMLFEEIVLDMKVDKEAELNPTDLILLDRGIPDTLAYYELYGWTVSKKLRQACKVNQYRKIFLLEMLDYEHDGVRVESEENARKLQDLFYKVYTEAGYNVIFIQKGTINKRVEEILSHVEKL